MPGTDNGGGRAANASDEQPRLRFAGRSVRLPGSRLLRIIIGVALCIGGLFAFLPVLGLWMLPLGLLVLSIDIPAVRRLRRRGEVAFGRWRANRAARRASRNNV